ncbi:DUF3349 domain-containing protein [Nocardioides dongxiaopingii]|uniref:DUF3349 domain-containing protein n=1 Tax=Nocardioides sp. S-1144 TaxID=2582905 RepID=UPI00110F346F|nr:DUF3349 domain-containing protein [Nocardioides sp. S-1144]QCW51095.1 DUF3349 domain-containing protein [Nocardioides sp. S-1144]
MTGPLSRVVAWLREGYPAGVPAQDYVPLLALLRRRLSDEEVVEIARELEEAGLAPHDHADIAVSISKVTDAMPSAADVDRVREHLAFRGFPRD